MSLLAGSAILIDRLSFFQHKEIIAEVKEHLGGVRRQLDRQISSNFTILAEIMEHVRQGQGKLMRPMLYIVSEAALENRHDRDSIEIAAAFELIHISSLLHDDVLDHSDQRRNRSTLNRRWDNRSAILMGDMLYSRACRTFNRLCNRQIVDQITKIVISMCEGQLIELQERDNLLISEKSYEEIIRKKSAELISLVCRVAAEQSKPESNWNTVLERYGLHLGMAFQIIDDVLDYTGGDDQFGKEVFNDLAEGNVTLPLIHALSTVPSEQLSYYQEQLKKEGGKRLEVLAPLLESVDLKDGLRYAERRAEEHADLARCALQVLPENRYRQALVDVTEFVVQRNS